MLSQNYFICLVISTPLKNISQIGSSFQLLGKIKAMFQTTNQIIICVSSTWAKMVSIHRDVKEPEGKWFS